MGEAKRMGIREFSAVGFYDEFSFLKNESFEVDLFFDPVFFDWKGFHWHVFFFWGGPIGLLFWERPLGLRWLSQLF